jgi:chromosome segregation ATPase
VPIFADPIEWDNHCSYESLTIVTHDGESYTSKCNVGPGVDITNTRYWAKTGAYNAQVEQYKNEVKDLSSQVSGFASDNAEFREKINQFTKDNAEMKNTVAEDKARVDALAERVATAETEIDGLQAITAQHTNEIADLHAKDEELQRQITSNDGDIAAIQAKNTEQDSRLNGIDTKLKSHDASIAQNTADIAKNTKNIQDNAAAIAKNAHELADHAEQLADHEGRLTAQHEEITANHQAIERLTSVTDGLRSDLTEDEAKIEANRDAIAHIQEKDVQQDGRMDKLEECCEQAKAHFTQLDTKTDNTNTALTAEIDRAKAAELANGKLIAKNAAELATHATELADHEQRITALEGDNATNKQEIADIKAKNTQQDTAIAGNADAIQHLTESTGDFVTKTAFNTDQKRQDDIVGDWATAHPGQTIAECATSQENELAEHAGQIAKLKTDKADKSEIPDVTGYVPTSTYNAGQAALDSRITTLENNSVSFPASVYYSDVDIATAWAKGNEREGNYASVILPFPLKTFPEVPKDASVSDVTVRFAEVLYLDGSPWYHINHNDVVLTATFVGAGVRLAAAVPKSSLPSDIETKSYILHFIVHATIS